MLGPEKCLDSNFLRIITGFFAVSIGEKNTSIFCNRGIGHRYETHQLEQGHLVTQEFQLCSCLQKCKWNANRYHNDAPLAAPLFYTHKTRKAFNFSWGVPQNKCTTVEPCLLCCLFQDISYVLSTFLFRCSFVVSQFITICGLTMFLDGGSTGTSLTCCSWSMKTWKRYVTAKHFTVWQKIDHKRRQKRKGFE